jgi:protein gp37
MSANSTIEWTERTWNPLTGCTKVTAGCDNCYAKTMHERFHGAGSFDQIALHPERLRQPASWRKPSKVFVNSMSDLFHKDVPDEFIARVFAVMAMAPQHTFQLLTKRHGRMRSLLSSEAFAYAVDEAAGDLGLDHLSDRITLPLPNVWLGVSVEDQKAADMRIPALVETPAAVRWISAEPLLGYVRIGQWADELDWVVAGGESGPGARPMHPDWARSLRGACSASGTPFLFKQWGAWTGTAAPDDKWSSREPDLYLSTDGRAASEELALASGGSWQGMWRASKKAAGRELDGVVHDEYPGGAQ